MESQESKAVASLAEVTRAQEAAVRQSRAPGWYYPLTGAVLALMDIFLILGSTPVRTIGIVALLVVTRVLETLRRRKTGSFVSGFRSGRATWWSVICLVVMFGVVAAGWLLTIRFGGVVFAIASAVLIELATVGYGTVFERSRLKYLPTPKE